MATSKLNLLAFDEETAAVGLVHAGEDLDETRLAGAVVAENAGDLAGVHVRRDVLERDDVAVVLADGVRLEQVWNRAQLDLARVARARKNAFVNTASTRIAPRNVYVQFESHPARMIPMLAMPRIAAPKLVPITDP